MGFKCVACDSGDCVEHGSVFLRRLAANDTITVAGMPLVRVHQCAECDTWELFDKPMNEGGGEVGHIALYHYPEWTFPSIANINMRVRGQGLGRQAVVALAQFYGGLTSDPQRNTNENAKKMWRAIPGVKEIPSPEKFQHQLDPDPARRLPWETGEPGKMFVLKGGWYQKFQSPLLQRQSKGVAKM